MLNDIAECKNNTVEYKNDTVECKMISLFVRREPKPQLGQPCYWAKPSKLCILGNGPRWLLVAALRFQRMGLL